MDADLTPRGLRVRHRFCRVTACRACHAQFTTGNSPTLRCRDAAPAAHAHNILYRSVHTHRSLSPALRRDLPAFRPSPRSADARSSGRWGAVCSRTPSPCVVGSATCCRLSPFRTTQRRHSPQLPAWRGMRRTSQPALRATNISLTYPTRAGCFAYV